MRDAALATLAKLRSSGYPAVLKRDAALATLAKLRSSGYPAVLRWQHSAEISGGESLHSKQDKAESKLARLRPSEARVN